MSKLTRILVLASTVAAIATAAYAASAILHSLPLLCGGAALIGGGVSRLSRRAGLAVSLIPAYLSPALFLLWLGRDHHTFTLVWISALLGVIVADGPARSWSVPARWRWPLVFWAMVIAMSWPVVALRELDFNVSLFWADRLPVANLKVSGAGSAAWTALVAVTHLVGILWVDWLFQEYERRDDRSFQREVGLPLAIGALLACAVGVYQGFFDIGFLSGHIWPSIHRAAGTLMDGNAFGMLAALWAPTFLVLGAGRGPAGIAAAALAFALAAGGVWTSGSRTALLAAVVGTTIAAFEIPWHVSSARLRRGWTSAVLGVAALLVALIALLPSVSTTPIERARHLLPSLSLGSLGQTTRALLWERDGYGPASIAMISAHPLLGIGVGTYHVLVYDYAREVGAVVPADNAQNWFRHQLAELGTLGSLGWIAWVALFGVTLWPRRSAPHVRPGAALRGPLIGFALASLLGMPGQDPAVAMTFWVLVFWYTIDSGGQQAAPRATSTIGWMVMLLLVGGYTVARAVPDDLRPPFRAARFGFPYEYGMYVENPRQVWTGRHAVAVLHASQKWLKLTVWVNHPDADRKAVHVDVWKDHDHIINERAFLHERLTRFVRVGEGQRFVLEARVDRTFRPSEHGSSDTRDLGLAMNWEFVPEGPK
jgi:hypothetical protein